MSKQDGLGRAGFPPPLMSTEQRKKHLAHANTARKFYGQLRAGEHDLAEVWAWGLSWPNSLYGRCRVSRYLIALPKVGAVKAERWMEQARIGRQARIGQLKAEHLQVLEPKVQAALRRPRNERVTNAPSQEKGKARIHHE